MTRSQLSNARIIVLLILLVVILGVAIDLASPGRSEKLDQREIRNYQRLIVANATKATGPIALLDSLFPGLTDSRRGELLEELGRTKDPRLIEFLLDTAVRRQSSVIAARAGGALRHFASLDQTRRKEICKRLIREFMNVHYLATTPAPANQQNSRARAILRAVSEPWTRTLAALTGQRLEHPDEWVTFWNRHRKSDWNLLASGPPTSRPARTTGGAKLSGDLHDISIRQGGTQTLTVNAGRAHANRHYRVFGSITGTTPGIDLLGVPIPLMPDQYSDVVLAASNPVSVEMR